MSDGLGIGTSRLGRLNLQHASAGSNVYSVRWIAVEQDDGVSMTCIYEAHRCPEYRRGR